MDILKVKLCPSFTPQPAQNYTRRRRDNLPSNNSCQLRGEQVAVSLNERAKTKHTTESQKGAPLNIMLQRNL